MVLKHLPLLFYVTIQKIQQISEWILNLLPIVPVQEIIVGHKNGP